MPNLCELYIVRPNAGAEKVVNYRELNRLMKKYLYCDTVFNHDNELIFILY